MLAIWPCFCSLIIRGRLQLEQTTRRGVGRRTMLHIALLSLSRSRSCCLRGQKALGGQAAVHVPANSEASPTCLSYFPHIAAESERLAGLRWARRREGCRSVLRRSLFCSEAHIRVVGKGREGTGRGGKEGPARCVPGLLVLRENIPRTFQEPSFIFIVGGCVFIIFVFVFLKCFAAKRT